MKTFNSRRYWLAQHPTEKDNVWDREPERTEAFMADITCPWIAYKILGGRRHRARGGLLVGV